jgi:hypothetical protein
MVNIYWVVGYVFIHSKSKARGVGRNAAVAASMAKFNQYQQENDSLSLDLMDDVYLQFPREFASYCDHFIKVNLSSSQTSLETSIKTLFQAIKEKFTLLRLDDIFYKARKTSYKEFQETILSRFTGELSLQRDMGVRSSDVATCKVLPIVSKMVEMEHCRYHPYG